MRIPMLAAAAALFLAACTTTEQAPPETAVAWPTAPRDFASAEELSATAAAFPNSAGMQRRLLGPALQANDAAATLAAMQRLAAMGAVLSAAGQGQVAQVVGAEAMAPITRQMAANAAPLAGSQVHATIPTGYPLIEGLIWDSSASRLYATSVVGRTLIAVDGGAAASTGQFGSPLGAAYDPVRRRIWAVSAEVEPTPRDRPNFIGLVELDPSDPDTLHRISAPMGASPGDVAVARDGNVYVSDGMNGALYVCRPGCKTLDTLLPAGTLFSAQGLALSADQRLLYIADRRYGLAALDRASGRVMQVRGAPEMMLDGMDGLVNYRGDLIATQNAYAPARIVRLRLSRDGLRVTALDVLERAHPDWGEVTLMAVAGDRLLYVGDAQWDRFGAGGAPNPQNPPQPTPIRSLPLR